MFCLQWSHWQLDTRHRRDLTLVDTIVTGWNSEKVYSGCGIRPTSPPVHSATTGKPSIKDSHHSSVKVGAADFTRRPLADTFLYRALVRVHVNAYKSAKFQLPSSVSYWVMDSESLPAQWWIRPTFVQYSINSSCFKYQNIKHETKGLFKHLRASWPRRWYTVRFKSAT